MMDTKEDERTIGLEVFYSDTKGLGGKLRKSPEDFIVNEVSIYPPEDPNGAYTIAKIQSRNWETNRLVRQLSRGLGISRKRIGFAGTKDRRGISTRLFSIKAPLDEVKRIKLKDVELLDTFSSKKSLDLGDLLGNEFEITIRDCDDTISDANEIILNTKEEMDELGGLPNFFGHQRFGSFRPITHIVGKRIIEGDFKGAVLAYLGGPQKIEGEEAFLARKSVEDGESYADALLKFPKHLGFEKALLNHLVAKEDDFTGALENLPKNLQMMFVHAYQSFLFNRILSMRIKQKLPLNEPLLGDIILPKDSHGLAEPKNPITVKEDNIDKVKKKVNEGKAAISGLVFGYETKMAGGLQGEIEAQILQSEGVNEGNFIIPKIKKLSSKGMRRELVSQVKNFQFENLKDHVKMSFALNKGCYATSLLREYMKTDMLQY
jgi:tRNA pseudouridine13 synthase